jgi:hypothetical protein
MANTQWIKVLRPFFYQKEALPEGAVVEVPAWLAAETVHANQAALAEQPAPAPVAEPSPEPKGTKYARK